MDKLKGFLIILLCNFAGSAVIHLTGLPVPGSVLGMLLLFALLLLKAVKFSTVEPVSRLLIGLMLLFILPSSIGLMNSFDKLACMLVQLTLIAVTVTAMAMVSAGWAAQLAARLFSRGKGRQDG